MKIFSFILIFFPLAAALPIQRQEIVQAHYFFKLHEKGSLECGDYDRAMAENITWEWFNVKSQNGPTDRVKIDDNTGRLYFKKILNTDSASFYCRLRYRLKGTMEERSYIVQHIIQVYENPNREGNCKPGYRLFKDDWKKTSRCYACLPGEYSEGQKQCKACPLSTYNGDHARDKCLDCPSGQFTLKYGQKTVGDCMGLNHIQDHISIWLALLVPLLLLPIAVSFLICWAIRKKYANPKHSVKRRNNVEELEPLLESGYTEEMPPDSNAEDWNTLIKCANMKHTSTQTYFNPTGSTMILENKERCQTSLNVNKSCEKDSGTLVKSPQSQNSSTQTDSSQPKGSNMILENKERFQTRLNTNKPCKKDSGTLVKSTQSQNSSTQTDSSQPKGSTMVQKHKEEFQASCSTQTTWENPATVKPLVPKQPVKKQNKELDTARKSSQCPGNILNQLPGRPDLVKAFAQNPMFLKRKRLFKSNSSVATQGSQTEKLN